MAPSEIHRVATLDLKVRPAPWRFANERRDEIDAHFAKRQRQKPEIWNGRVLIGRNPLHTEGRVAADFFETDFASFLAWREWGFPDRSVFNGFGMGALRSSDGAFLLGEMGTHTANAGQIYFPCGTPDPNDIKDGSVNIAGSITREIAEETGLDEADYTMDMHWTCVFTPASIAMIRILRVDMPGEALKTRVEANLARQRQPELSAVHLVRTRADIVSAMPLFVTAFLEAQLPELRESMNQPK